MSSTVASETTNWLLIYEQLRKDALSSAAALCPAPGLALFLRKGMAAWMRAWSPCVQNAAPETVPRPDTPPPCPLDVRTQLAGILACMILDQQLEITR